MMRDRVCSPRNERSVMTAASELYLEEHSGRICPVLTRVHVSKRLYLFYASLLPNMLVPCRAVRQARTQRSTAKGVSYACPVYRSTARGRSGSEAQADAEAYRGDR